MTARLIATDGGRFDATRDVRPFQPTRQRSARAAPALEELTPRRATPLDTPATTPSGPAPAANRPPAKNEPAPTSVNQAPATTPTPTLKEPPAASDPDAKMAPEERL